MKVKALINCVGLGYSMEQGKEYEIDNKLAQKLINFSYVEEIKPVRSRQKKESE